MGYDVETRNQGRKIIDVKYTLRPASDFISEQKAANKRSRDAQNKASTVRAIPIR